MNENRINGLFQTLFPLQRSLLGEEVNRSIDLLQRNFLFDITKFPSQTKIFDWEVPRAWKLQKMTLTNSTGRIIWSEKHSPFATVFHSNPICTKLTLPELQKIVYTDDHCKDAVPYRTSYYSSDYGICMPKRVWETLNEQEYHLDIDAHFYDDSLKVCEYVIQGTSSKEILFCSYICHPSMANNELSGPVTLVSLIEQILENGYSGYYTLRFCLFPETIGALALLKIRGEHFKENLIAGYVLTCIGDNRDLAYKKSFQSTGNNNGLTEDALIKHNRQKPRIHSFEPFGSDERQFNSPAFRLPVGTLFRSKFGEYDEYHTDRDDLTMVSAHSVIDNVSFLLQLIDRHNSNLKYKRIIDHGEVFLSKYQLYNTVGAATKSSTQSKYLTWFLHLADGDIEIYDIAKTANLDFQEMGKVAELSLSKGIVKIVESR